jgi:uncharacterized protein (TIGR02594 family)
LDYHLFNRNILIMHIPKSYQWLVNEPGPKMLKIALGMYGIIEKPGTENNKQIIDWAAEVGGRVEDVYKADSIPWCGLFMAVVAKRAGYALPKDPLWALNWGTFGRHVDIAMLGDTVVLTRPGGGGHVALYVGEDKTSVHLLGGNQSDAVTVSRMAKSRIYAVRRPLFKIGPPPNIRQIWLTTGGKLSINES